MALQAIEFHFDDEAEGSGGTTGDGHAEGDALGDGSGPTLPATQGAKPPPARSSMKGCEEPLTAPLPNACGSSRTAHSLRITREKAPTIERR